MILIVIWQNIKENIEGHPVDWYGDVFNIIFPDVDAAQVNHMWKEQLKEPEKKEGKKDLIEEIESHGLGDM